jgi:phage terminase large subunit-like protein
MARPNLRQWDDLEPWTESDYQQKYDQALANDEFKLGMVSPLTNDYMYDATAIDDLDNYFFCFRTADLVCEFIHECITHIKPSRFAKFELHYTQRKFFRNVFGWKRKTDRIRRYREAFKYVPRKNSKSWDQGALCHIGMLMDGEEGVEIYNIACNKDQATKVFDPFVGAIKNDEERPQSVAGGFLADYYNIIGRTQIKAVTANNELDICKPVANDENAAHGGNAHFVVCDEIHAFSDGGMYDVMVTSMSVREQPLIVCITTADYSRESFCNTKLDYAKRIARNPNLDPRFLPILYYSDPDEFGDDWQDEAVWQRVNPMLGIAKKWDYMRDMFRKATNEPTFTNTFKRLDLNICTMSENAAFNVDKWKKCHNETEDTFDLLGQAITNELMGADCFVGMDNAYKNDLNALVLDFPATDYVLCFNWCPTKHPDIVKLDDDYGHYLLKAGGNEIDFEEVYRHMQLIFETFHVREIGFDPNKSMEIRNLLKKDYPEDFFCTIAQNTTNLSEPIKKIIGDVNNLRVNHTGNPLFTWQVSNCDIKEDNRNDYMIVKPKGIDSRRKKVDGVVAWVMARALRLKAEEEINFTDMIF